MTHRIYVEEDLAEVSKIDHDFLGMGTKFLFFGWSTGILIWICLSLFRIRDKRGSLNNPK